MPEREAEAIWQRPPVVILAWFLTTSAGRRAFALDLSENAVTGEKLQAGTKYLLTKIYITVLLVCFLKINKTSFL